LPFKLLSDTERRTAEAYDVLKDPADRTAGLARRVTYLIDPEGTIREAYKVEDIETHPARVLADLRAILGIKV
jgi:peroxiredoxin